MAFTPLLLLSNIAGSKPASAANPFIEASYLYNQGYDTDLSANAGPGNGNWLAYKNWLGVSAMAAEADPGWSQGDWWDCAQHTSWNAPWGTMQQRYGSALPTVVLGMGQMPLDPNYGAGTYADGWNEEMAWENQQWQLEANNDPTIMAYFANYAQEVDNGAGGSGAFNNVIIRLGYEFDGGWNPFGNLNVMSNMPNNYIQAWRNIITTMRANDPKHIIKFCWNPTDGNVQINSFSFYPGDAYVDYIGFDEYDYVYNGDYPVGTAQPTLAQQTAAWNDVELPRINAFSSFASSTNTSRPGYIAGRTVPLVVGEWGLWQLNDQWHPSGGDNPFYIQHMHDWMADPNNHVYLECYFEYASDGDHHLWPYWPYPTQSPTPFPNAAALYKTIFSDAGSGGGSAPAAPTGLAATAGNAQVSLTWTASSGATSYNIYRGTTAGGESATAIATGVSTASFVNTGLTNGTTYYYKVKAVNSVGSSGYSNEANAKPITGVPGAPTGLTATAGNAQVALSWAAVSGATSYNVYRGTTASGESATAIATGVTSASYTNTGLANGQAYFYKVKAVNASGTSGYSNEASATPTAGSAPAAPAWSSLTPGANSIFLSWYWTSGATSFNIYRGTTPGGESATPIATNVTYSSWNDTGLTNGQTYYYKLKAVNASGTSGYSPEASAIAGTAPDAPTWYSLTPGANSIFLSWIWPSGATSFTIYRGTTSGGESATPIASGVTSSSWNDTGLTNGQRYYYTVKAVNASGSSVMSSEDSAVAGLPPAGPTWSSLTPGSGSIFLSWYWTSGATSFAIYRGTTAGGESATPIATNVTSSSWNDAGLTHGQKYYYKLTATNASGTSIMSAEASATAQ